ncbi:Uncharacterized protein dnm_033440 [Desulfonema magnum]|uniref:Uncharacterized protein n=1 Tax=Desulfonema magnum TaxID=45655 RepID=A0A975GN24_9BACT|nr:Uncharacterized protein dnm_033440 [Desulfonema magnum]
MAFNKKFGRSEGNLIHPKKFGVLPSGGYRGSRMLFRGKFARGIWNL